MFGFRLKMYPKLDRVFIYDLFKNLYIIIFKIK